MLRPCNVTSLCSGEKLYPMNAESVTDDEMTAAAASLSDADGAAALLTPASLTTSVTSASMEDDQSEPNGDTGNEGAGS